MTAWRDHGLDKYVGESNPLTLLVQDALMHSESKCSIQTNSGSALLPQVKSFCEQQQSLYGIERGCTCLIVGDDNASTAMAIILCLFCGSSIVLAEENAIESNLEGYLSEVSIDFRIRANGKIGASFPAIQVERLSKSKPKPVDLPEGSLVMSTSGTSAGGKKGVLLTQKSVFSNLLGILAKQVFRPKVTHVNIIPLTHAFGLMADLIIPLALECSVYYSKDVVDYLSAIARIHPGHLNFPPAVSEVFAKRLNASQSAHALGIDNARLLCAGAPMKQWAYDSLRSHGFDCYVGYGLTECSPCVSLTSTAEIGDETLGSPLFNLEVRINGADSELLVRGSCLFLGYVTERGLVPGDIDEAGWLHTGDTAAQDEKNRLRILGRLDDVVVFSDGTKYQARAIEESIEGEIAIDACMAKKHPDRDSWIIEYYADNSESSEQIEAIIRARVAALETSHTLEEIVRVDSPFESTSALGKLRRNT